MPRVRIPKRWEDVTPEWMTAVLARRHPDARVKSVELITRDDGTNRRARFGVTYASGSGPARVFLKAHAPRHRWVHFRNGNLFNEARLFASDAVLPLDHPLVYCSVTELWNLDFLLVMEDIIERGADPRDATRPLTVEQVANGLRSLARLHSHHWNLSRASHPNLAWLKTWAPTKGWQIGLRRRVPIGIARTGGKLPDEVARFDGSQVVDLWARYVEMLGEGPMTLLHADAHIGNTFVLPNNEVGFLDWQVVRRGAWHQDAGYFLVGSLTEADRRASERELMEIYAHALELPADARPSPEEVWLWYRTTPAYGLAIWLSTLGTEGYQRPEVSMALVQRYASAFAELETIRALERVGA